ncbi:MAG: FAD:protein FMN transferase [Candidatus Nanopelagicales bacterium]
MSTNRFSFPVMGTVASLTFSAAIHPQLARIGAQAARTSLDADEQRFSHFRVGSDVERWLAGHAVGPEAIAELRRVFSRCQELSESSAGAFRFIDPAGRIDTAGYVKGYAIGKAVTAIRETGIADFTVNVGGDSYSAGRPDSRRPWRVAVTDPRDARSLLAIVDATDLAVATSGTAQRGRHIWRHDGTAATDLLSLTITGPDIAWADAYATAALAMGRSGPAWVATHDGYQALALAESGECIGGLRALVGVG